MKTVLSLLMLLFSTTIAFSNNLVDSLQNYPIMVYDTTYVKSLKIRKSNHQKAKRNQRSVSSTELYNVDIPKFVPKSPTVSSMMQFVDIPVSHYTGIPNISIPIYEIDIDELKIPINLNYHSSGIRVDQEASWVGLGWALDVGGVINRTIKCGDDFYEYSPTNHIEEGYLTAPEVNEINYAELLGHYYLQEFTIIYYLKADSEPDIFSYSLPNVKGKFLIDKSRGTVLLDKSTNVKIELIENDRSKQFQITTPDGVKYVLSLPETTYSYNRNGYLNKNYTINNKFDEDESFLDKIYSSPFKYTSSWFLTEIITPTNKHIYFNYNTESCQYPVQESLCKYNDIESKNLYSGPKLYEYSCSKTIVDTHCLKSIEWDGGVIEFETSNREDIKGRINTTSPRKLDKVNIFDASNNLVKGWKFDYSYFNESYSGNAPHVFKRLKLLSVSNIHDLTAKYNFNYYEKISFPAKNSKNTDYWGFYNGINQGEHYHSPAKDASKLYHGADKTPNLQYTQTGILTSIQHPTKGYTQLVYEGNQYSATPSTSTVTHHQTSHLNVYKESQYDTYSNYEEYDSETITLHTITDFEILGFAENESCQMDPDIQYDDENYTVFCLSRLNSQNEKNPIVSYTVPNVLKGESCSYDYPILNITLATGTYLFEAIAQAKDVWFCFNYSYDKTETVTMDSVMYGGGLRIAKIIGPKNADYTYTGGKILIDPIVSYNHTHISTDDLDFTDRGTYFVQMSESTIPLSTLKSGNIVGYDKIKETHSDDYTVYEFYNDMELTTDCPFVPSELNCYNGLPKRTIHYNKFGNKMKEIIYTQSEEDQFKAVHGFFYLPPFGGLEQINPYTYYIYYPKLSQQTTIIYESNGNHTISYDYTYDENFQLKKTAWDMDGDLYIQENIYPTELSDTISQIMTDSYMIGIPVEKRLLKNNSIIKGLRTIYSHVSGMILPNLEQELLFEQSNYSREYYTKLKYLNYNTYGKTQQIVYNGEHITYLWGYKSQYPIAEIKNATFQQVEQLLTMDFISQLANKDIPSESDWTKINNLRNQLPFAEVRTFTYKPLVGILTDTDRRGFTTYYTYDNSGRLIEIYIKEGSTKHILKKHEYHYKN